MKLYSYVVVSDTGFAPNPFDNFCTLATCKPRIRKNAKIGDIIIGTGSKSNVGNNKLIYAMKITERMNYNDYFNDNRFIGRSDNIYYLDNNSWKQKKTNHHESEEDIKRDLSGLYVLVSDNYYYFGKKAVVIPSKFHEIIKIGTRT